MADQKLLQLESALRKQQMALVELIDIMSHGLRESNDTSVAAVHALTRLQALAKSFRRSLSQSPSTSGTSSAGTDDYPDGRRPSPVRR